jgi:hypothetical protein
LFSLAFWASVYITLECSAPVSVSEKSQSVDGADASAFFYSLIETAKRSNLNPMDYVEAVCTFGPGCKTDSEWEALLPDKIDFTRLGEIRIRRFVAKPDPGRATPCNFVGTFR